MNNYIENRVLEVAAHIINTKENIRATAKKFGIGKTTVHNDLMVRLPKLNPQLAMQARTVLDYNKEQRAYRGGEATRSKYKAS